MPPPDGRGAQSPVHDLIRRQLDGLGHRDDADVARLLAEIERRYGARIAAVLLYGSYLRGKRDTLLDFYVLLTDLRGALPPVQAWGNHWLPPNVYYLSLPALESGQALRAKYATMTLAQFEAAMSRFHSYFWSRFTQPTGLARARDEDNAQRVAAAMVSGLHTLADEVAPLLHPGSSGTRFSSRDFWQRALSLTYGCELRSEAPEKITSLYEHHTRHFDELLAVYAGEPEAAIAPAGGGRYTVRPSAPPRRAARRWSLRRLQGKTLSVLRLIKAATTFDDPLDYLLWKIERHSGIYLAPTERQRRHPLIFAWPLLWRLYRRGAFR